MYKESPTAKINEHTTNNLNLSLNTPELKRLEF